MLYLNMFLFLLKILEQRHAQEMQDLDKTFQEERRVGIDESLAKMEEEHAVQMDKLRKAHGEEFKRLESENLPSEEYQQRKAQLLNKQQLQLSALERKHSEELRKLKTSATADWEVRYARAKLELKEKHYQVKRFSSKYNKNDIFVKTVNAHVQQKNKKFHLKSLQKQAETMTEYFKFPSSLTEKYVS